MNYASIFWYVYVCEIYTHTHIYSFCSIYSFSFGGMLIKYNLIWISFNKGTDRDWQCCWMGKLILLMEQLTSFFFVLFYHYRPVKLIEIMKQRFISLGGVIFEGYSVSNICVYEDAAVSLLTIGKYYNDKILVIQNLIGQKEKEDSCNWTQLVWGLEFGWCCHLP